MDSLFDDKPYEVGDEIEGYCPNARCRGDTVHVIKGMYENEIRRVECSVCGDTHGYRKPRGVPFDEEQPQEPALRSKTSKKKPSWEEAMAKVTEQELAKCRPYSTLDNYELLDVVSHPIFDVGFVTELLPDNKVEVTFKDKERILVHRKDDGNFASKISEVPAPRRQRPKRKRRQKGPSELAQKLMSARMLAQAGTENFQQVAEAKEELAERAALENRRLALEMIVKKLAKGVELTDTEKRAAKEAEKLAKEDEKRRQAEERERKRVEREKERERKRVEREKAREKDRLRKEKEREKLRKQKEREREKLQKQKEREQLQKEREREKLQKQKEREKLRLQREKERERKRKAAERQRKEREVQRKREALARAKVAKASERIRRTGGKKSIAAVRRTGGKKSIASIRRTGGKKTIPSRRR